MSTAHSSRRTCLDGLKILLVEDDFMLAEVTKGLLEDNGCQVVGPVGRLDEGLACAGTASLDGAILDINLHGELSFAIAEMLSGRGVPFLFMTGYQDRGIMPASLRAAPRLDKPVPDDRLLAAALATFGRSRGAAAHPQDDVLPSARHAVGERPVRAGQGASRGPGIRR